MFRCNNLRKEKYFPNVFFVHFLNLDSISKIYKKNDPHSLCIFELPDSERRG